MRPDGDAEPEAPAVDLDGACVRRVRRDAEPHERRFLEPPALLRVLPLGVGRLAREDLEEDDRPQAELRGRCRGRAGIAVVRGGRDAGGERVEHPLQREREHRRQVEQVLARNVRRDPGPEGLPVAEARVARVLEVRVRVDEAREDCGVLEVPFGATGADVHDLAAFEPDPAVRDRRPVDGQHPVRRHFPHSAAAAVSRCGCQRRSKKPESASETR